MRRQLHRVWSMPSVLPFGQRLLPICAQSGGSPEVSAFASVKRLDEITCFARHKASFRLPTEEWERTVRSGDQPFSACISVEILIVAKLENVSDTAYGKMIWPLCLIAPQV